MGLRERAGILKQRLIDFNFNRAALDHEIRRAAAAAVTERAARNIELAEGLDKPDTRTYPTVHDQQEAERRREAAQRHAAMTREIGQQWNGRGQ